MINQLKQYGTVLENTNLKEYNTFKIGGKAKYIVFPETVSHIKELLSFLKKLNIKYFIIGNGSNIILNDKYYDGVIIKLDKLKTIEIYPETNCAYVEAGVMLPIFAKECLKNGLIGLEWATGIPGTIGGSIVSNAGAYKSEIFDFIKSVTVIDPNGNLKKLSKEDISHSYRTTMFKEKKNYCILMAEFELKKGDIETAKNTIEERYKRRMTDQPLEYPSAGSVFRNPDEENTKDIILKHNLKGPFAGHLIEKCGLKGKRIGGAQISAKHANFIVNIDNAKAEDIKELIELSRTTVLEKYGIDLIAEQEFINWE